MTIPNEHIKRISIFASIYFILFIAVHLKNYFQVGELFGVIKGDDFDEAFKFLSMPGFIPTIFMGILIFFNNIHDIPNWFLEAFSLIFNCLFYGLIFGRLLRKFSKP